MNSHPNIKNTEEFYSEGLHPDIPQFVMEAIEGGDESRLKSLISGLHVADLADLVKSIPYDHLEDFVRITKSELPAELFVELEGDLQEKLVESLENKHAASVITNLDTDDAVYVMESMDGERQQEILEEIPSPDKEKLKESLSHEEDTAGRIMDHEYVAIPEDWDVGHVIDYLRKEAKLPQDFYSIFVVDNENRPIGELLVSRVIRNKRDIAIKDIMSHEVKVIDTDMDQEEVAHIFHKYGLASAPVVDDTGRIKAIITVDDVVDVIHEEASEDIMRLGGVERSDFYSSYIKTAWGRFPWLFINLLTAIAASAVIALFEDSIAQLVVLAVLMPIVASMAGNAGTQTLTVTVRAIATKELRPGNNMGVIVKELKAALLNGFGFAVIVASVAMLFYNDLELSMVFAFATTSALIIAGVAGVIIPVILDRMSIDPAVASSVFLTTVTDISAFFIFLGAASWIIL